MILSTPMITALATGSVVPRWLFWFSAKNRTTGAIESSGLWNGLDALTINVDGVERVYQGASGLGALPVFTFETGLLVQNQEMQLSGLSAQVVEMIRSYDARLCATDVYLALFNPTTEALIGTARAYQGWIDKIDISDGVEDSTVTLGLVSTMRAGTKSLGLKQSDTSQRLRDSTDAGRKYADVSSTVKVSWGMKSDQSPNWVDPAAQTVIGTIKINQHENPRD